MLTRVAVFEGAITPGGEDAFFSDVAAKLEGEPHAGWRVVMAPRTRRRLA